MSESSSASEKKIAWWQLALTGVGCTIGTGYFLGSSIGIQLTGPSIVLSFLIAAIGTYIVFNLLAKMSAADPQEGSFCYYAEKAFGKWAGFSCGWNYWCSSILIMGSQLIALAILTKVWFPNLPLWVFAAVYAVLSVLVILLGTRGFDRIEDFLAVIKTAAIIMFIIIAFIAIAGGISGGSDAEPGIPTNLGDTFSGGYKGFWASLIYAFYAFGGIEVIGLMAIRLKKKEDAPKTGKVMLGLLAIIYIISLCLAVIMAPVEKFDPNESPFVTALSDYSLAFFPHVFNAAIIVAGFSTMTAALFGVVTLLVTLAKDGDAPKIFSKKIKKFKELPLPSLLIATVGLAVSVITALLLPEKIYEYITTAAGILLLFNWAFIILSSWRVLKGVNLLIKMTACFGLLFITAAVSGTLMDKSVRPGFWISLLLVLIISIITLFMQRHWNDK
ncbi:amino acid permease [Gracilibacillus sp. D59]|uniref:amino acid permease n=1 Tax=Gracilibacillus sp. D59 TaxID=3457434 RepID=UPI003FCD911A